MSSGLLTRQRRKVIAAALTASLIAMPSLLISESSVSNATGHAFGNRTSGSANLAQGQLSENGVLRYIYHSAVDVGEESQAFPFTVPSNTTAFTNGSYMIVELDYSPLGSGSSELDLNVWDVLGQRTGGGIVSGQLSAAEIPDSTYLDPGNFSRVVRVGSVAPSLAGLWSVAVFCSSDSSIGSLFTIVITVLLDEQLPIGSDGPSFKFGVRSNVIGIDAQLEHLETLSFSFSIRDMFGRRTGGWTAHDAEQRQWIPNSAYDEANTSTETISISPVLSSNGANGSGELWSASASHPLTFSPGFYALTVEITCDSDGDGIADSIDIDPVHDLAVRLLVTSIGQLDIVDDASHLDPYLRIAVGERVSNGEASGGAGDAWETNIWQRSKVPIVVDSDFSGEYSMWLNVPDDSRTVSLLVQLWDHDIRGDDICDISPRSGGGSEKDQDTSTIHLVYDLIGQTWYGDVSVGIASGASDGSAGLDVANDQDDAVITFGITTVHEISFADRLDIAQRFNPVIYLDPLEHAGPLEIWSMLNQSEIRDSSGELLRALPAREQDLVEFRGDSYLRLRERETAGYYAQIYANVMTTDNDTIVAQYWFFYLYDSVSPHQGDWEMIQATFAERSRNSQLASIEPLHLTYSQHYGGEVRLWNESGILMNGTHPAVFVVLGGHASIFSGPVGPGKTYPLSIMSPSPWLNFSGKWGSSKWRFGAGGNSVPGPAFRASMHMNWLGKPTSPEAYIWHEPLNWEARLR